MNEASRKKVYACETGDDVTDTANWIGAYPLELERFLSPRLWGGNRLVSFLNLDKAQLPDADEPLGESWQVYAKNRIKNGDLAGQTFEEAAQRYGAALLGRSSVARYGLAVPLLAKFIDAADKLSIQVHPDDAYAREHEAQSGHLGKSEAWYILEAEPGAEVIWGFKDALDEAALREAVRDGKLGPHLNHVPVEAGDVVYNPAGTVHGIGAGIVLFEIQESSDLTYRLYDYDRRGASGEKRELHVDKALEVADLSPGERAKVTPKTLSAGKTELLNVEHFAAERWEVSGRQNERTNPESFDILTVIGGGLELTTQSEKMSLSRGASVVLPASLGDYTLEGQATLLRCYVP